MRLPRFMSGLVLAVMAMPVLAACTGLPDLSSPSSIADQTTLDERAATSVALAYRAARTAGVLAVQVGALDGPNAVVAQSIDSCAFAGVMTVDAAYRSGNSESYQEAVDRVQPVITTLLAIATGSDGEGFQCPFDRSLIPRPSGE